MDCNCTSFSAPLRTMQDLRDRGAQYKEIVGYLALIASDSSGWKSVLKCRSCGALWGLEYPFGEHHGDGPACLYRISTEDPDRWLQTERGLTLELRQAHEDQEFFEILGEEVGPETCRHPGCRRKHVKLSVMCQRHHFLMIKGREYEDASNSGP